MNIIQRVQSPTPRFFKKLRNISLVLATVGGALLAAPVAVPAFVLKVAGFLTVAGGVGSAVSQAVTKADEGPINDGESGC